MQKEQHQKAAESDESSQSSARPKWDTPFNRALNILKKVPVDKPPSYGRVHGVGDGASWKTCYHQEPVERKKRWAVTQQSTDEKVKIAVDKSKVETKEELLGAVNAAVTDAVVSLLPSLFDFTKNDPNA